MATRYALAGAMRTAAVDLLRGFATQEVIGLSVYRARPARLQTPHAFIDRLRERDAYVGPTNIQRVIQADVLVVWGLFDSGDAIDQRDRFVDGFGAYVAERHDAAGPNTLISHTSFEDLPVWTPDWFPDEQPTYFATRITLEGYAET